MVLLGAAVESGGRSSTPPMCTATVRGERTDRAVPRRESQSCGNHGRDQEMGRRVDQVPGELHAAVIPAPGPTDRVATSTWINLMILFSCIARQPPVYSVIISTTGWTPLCLRVIGGYGVSVQTVTRH